MPVPTGPKGTRDFFPDEMAFQSFIFSSWEKTCRRYGFEQYDGPTFERLDLYTKKSGAEIEDQLYAFKDKKGRDLALRPEITPTLARMVASRGTNLKLPLRWYSIPRLFRYEKMQKGRLREFFQLNMDIIGIAEVSADAELIAASVDMMRLLGFSAADFKVRISSRTLLEELITAAGMTGNDCGILYSILDKKTKLSSDEFDRILFDAFPDKKIRSRIGRIFELKDLDDVRKLGSDTPAYTTLKNLMDTLMLYGFSEYVAFDIGTVRGLAYYTGIVFEVFDNAKSMRAVAGGGRYDRLIEQYGGPPVPAAGFAAGDVVLADLMREKGISPVRTGRSFCYIAALEGTSPAEVISLVQELRAAGVSCEFSLKDLSVGKQMKNANAARALFVLFAGGDESKKGMVKIKDMSSGNESMVARHEIVNSTLRLLSLNRP
ncbi:MAG: histidine--tRNA ligase [Chitinispirillaceae bacterium]|nr:histidine--tRNA ligase [Chitinispirillaceae bacterium]